MKQTFAFLAILFSGLLLMPSQAVAEKKRPCPIFSLLPLPPGCKYISKDVGGCPYPSVVCGCQYLQCLVGQKCQDVTCVKAPCPPVCKSPCPVFSLVRPPPGCKIAWKVVDGCSRPYRVCGCQYLQCPAGQTCKEATCTHAPCPPVCSGR